jgi:hypothetical protein
MSNEEMKLRRPQAVRHIVVSALAVSVLLLVWKQSSSQAQITNPQPAPTASQTQSFTLIFGSKDPAPAKWDGSVSVSKGMITEIRGHHFTQSCKVLPGNKWECATHPWGPFAGGMHPNEKPQPQPTPMEPVGITILAKAPPDAEFLVEVPRGNFHFRPMDVPETGGIFPLQASVELYRTPLVQQVTDGEYEDDYPAIATDGDSVWLAWQGYKNESEHVFLRRYVNGAWRDRMTVTEKPGDIFQPAVVASGGRATVTWSERDGENWHVKARHWSGSNWSAVETVTLAGGSNVFPRAAGDGRGNVYVVYQSWRRGASDIYLRSYVSGQWRPEIKLSQTAANDWSPAVVCDRKGAVWVAWDTYENGSYNIQLRTVEEGKPGPVIAVTNSGRFHAHASLAVDAQNRLWIAYDEAPENWAKDVGFLLTGGTGIYEARDIRVAVFEAGRAMNPLRQPGEMVPYGFKRYFQTPRLVPDSEGRMWLFARPRTSARLPTSLWAAGGKWEAVGAYYNGERWSDLIPIPESVGRNEGELSTAADAKGNVFLALVTDHRLWGGPNFGMPPGNNDIQFVTLRSSTAVAPLKLAARGAEPPTGTPTEPREREQVAALRKHVISAEGKTYRIYRGDMHRHTEISMDGAGDGSLVDAYRYAMDAAALDYFAVTDHQSGVQEYTVWRIQKSSDLFHVPGSFTTLYGTERSLGYPNGHRNLMMARRGIPILPIGPQEQMAARNTGEILYPYLRQNKGIATSHTSHTGMGTDWRDNDPELEPIVEIFQGARTNAEHEGAPLAPTEKRTELHAGGYRPLGFVWNAWAKGYKLGVQASSDHVSTHTSYAYVIAENSSRETLIDAMRRRHTYAATSNMLLDYRLTAGGKTALQGDEIEAAALPEVQARIVGSGPLRKVVVVRDNQYVYSQEPTGETFELRFRETQIAPGTHYYYVRVEQKDGNVAWSSPVWVKYTGR